MVAITNGCESAERVSIADELLTLVLVEGC